MELNKVFPDVTCSAFITHGTFEEELKLFTKAHKVEAVVMGLGSKNKLSGFIYGSHGESIAGKIEAPVIIIPDNYKKHRLKTMLLAVDNREKLNKSPLTTLERIVKQSNVAIQALHVRTKSEIFEQELQKLTLNKKELPVQLKRAKNLENGLKNYCKKNPVDLVALISKKHSVFYNFFAETHTKKIIFASRVPGMARHE